ncbi:cytochrome C oxidase subunit IV family protein [Pseudohalioglobus lutimaris]|uniref:Cytochrome C oxidase subunit IV n=1 Tax=Pseudohalioglobus lutimaris TaxID=1737061 RepID=A0A2N5X291_9GAMM|nr:cytochrome C oxidase subunit IV family protein [Pseudohalioglobus lutimaris]PLW68606.1 hypothetical protein C0039_11350 [Pseudohalioglobus lutimaris]
MDKHLPDDLPGQSRLLKTWLMLMALTLFSMWSAQLSDESRALSLPIWSVALVLLSVGFKVQQILMVYLNLRVSSAGWRGGFLCLLAVTILLVGLGYWSAKG